MQTTTLLNHGLFTYPDLLGEIPPGALTTASNVVIDRDGVIAPRRGFAVYGGDFGVSSTTAKQLLYYKARILRHWETSLDFDSDGMGTFVNMSNIITEQSPGVKIKGQEMNGNFYFTTDKGIQKISATCAANVSPLTLDGNTYGNTIIDTLPSTANLINGLAVSGSGINPGTIIQTITGPTSITISQPAATTLVQTPLTFGIQAPVTWAGGVEALDGVAYINPIEGWFLQDSQVAYRVVWGTTDENNNLILGTPSQRIVINNPQLSLTVADFNKLLISLDIAASVPPVVLTGNSHSNTIIDGLSTTANLSIGMTVADTTDPSNIPSGTIIESINSTSSITISNPATTNNVGDTYSFGQVLSNINFYTLQLPTDASSTELYAALQSLAEMLDASLNENIYNGLSDTITLITPSVSISGTANPNNTNVLYGLSSVQGLADGQFISGPGVPANTYITSISSPSPIVLTGTLASDTAVSAISNTAPLSAGMLVTGDGIPVGTTIQSIVDANDITLSQNATNSNVGVSLTFTNNTITLNNVVAYSLAGTTYTASYPTIVTSPGHELVTGDEITITGTNSTPSIDTTSPIVVTVLNSNQFTIPTITTSGGNTGTWYQYPLAVSQNYLTAPSNPATNAQLVLLQNFYDALVNNLNLDQNISDIAREAIGGDFANSTQTATTNVIFTVPSLINTNYFWQVYRSDMATAIGPALLSDESADDECKLIVQTAVTSQDIANGFINFYDNVPESFRVNGANLYTNAISGAGILQENTPPPYSQDITLWLNYMFYANTSEKHQLTVDLLTGSGLIGQTFTTQWNGIFVTYTFVADVAQETQMVVSAGSTFNTSGTANYFDIYNAQNYTTYRVWFDVVGGTMVAPSSTGVTLIPVSILSTDTTSQVAAKLQLALTQANQDFGTALSAGTIDLTNLNPGYTNSPITTNLPGGFTITVTTPGSGERGSTQSIGVPNSPTPAQQIDAVARSLVRIVNENPQGGIDAQYLSGPTDLPGQISFEAIETSLIPFYLTASAPIGADFDPVLPASGETVVSTNQARPNRLYFSKIQQPDAVPQVNYVEIGQEDYPISRIMPLRDSLFVLKQDGVFRLYGTDPTNFTVYLFDSSAKLLAQDTAVVLNNQVFMFSNQGVVTVSDTGVSVVSRPIEGSLLPINLYPNFTSTSFGVTYESDRSYHLWAQGAATDTVPTICYRYNTFTSTWVEWPIEKTCGVVIPDTNVMYLGPADTNFIEQERKSYTRLDQADRDYEQTVPVGAVRGTTLSLGSVFEAEPGDALVQTQYLTVAEFNRLINKLDIDPGTEISYLPYLANPGDNLRSDLTILANALDSDPGLSIKTYASSISGYADDFVSTQEAFNVIINLLGTDLGIRLHSYTLSTGTVGWEVLVSSINTVKNTIITAYALPFIAGPIFIYKAIDSITQWAPQHMGDPSMLKKVHEGTIMFQNMAFDNGSLSYSSDLNTGSYPILFTGEGADAWGGSYWGNTTWGGDGTSRPFRTYVPVPIQRCRFIQPQFEHDNALRTYAIFGVSYTWEGVSSRAYR